MKKLGRAVYIGLIVLLGAVLVYSAASLILYFSQSRESQQQYSGLAAMVDAARPTVSTYEDHDPTAPTEETVSPYVTVTDPDTGASFEILREYASLYEMNSDLVGWIAIDGTMISYPVVQSPDRTDYYLHRNFYREDDAHGCIYAREQCDMDAPSDNITLYGHRMKDHTMFGHLAKYEDKAFWEAHPYIRFDTLTAHHTYQIIAVFTTTATLGEGFQYHLFVDAGDDDAFENFVAQCKALSLYDTGITAAPGDKLITLSTCEYTQENGRLVVVAKRIS